MSELAKLIANKANECCYRSDGWMEDVEQFVDSVIQPVREMTVEEVEEYIYAETRRFTETSALLALAKLGTIRIVG